MFNDTKYTRWYDSIIFAAKKRAQFSQFSEYTEQHHIIPKSMGGGNNLDNIVRLTAREHYICHLLLPKMCINANHRVKMTYAYLMMSQWNSAGTLGHRYNSKCFARMKIRYIRFITGSAHFNYGKRLSQDDRRKRSELFKRLQINVGAIRTPEQRAKISQTRIANQTGAGENNSMFGKNHSDESKQQMSITKKQKIQENPEAHKSKAIAANPKTKRVVTDIGEIFPSLSEAGRAYGYAGAQGVRSRIAKGLWKYLD